MSPPFAVFATSGVAIMALTSVIAVELGVGSNDDVTQHLAPPSSIGGAPPAKVLAIPPLDLKSVSDAVLARPLFSPSRRPASKRATVAAAADPAKTANLPRLTGIVTDEHTRLAIFQPRDSDKSVVIGEGGEIGGRRIVAISENEVLISGGSGDEHLRPQPDPLLMAAEAVMPPPQVNQAGRAQMNFRPGRRGVLIEPGRRGRIEPRAVRMPPGLPPQVSPTGSRH